MGPPPNGFPALLLRPERRTQDADNVARPPTSQEHRSGVTSGNALGPRLSRRCFLQALGNASLLGAGAVAGGDYHRTGWNRLALSQTASAGSRSSPEAVEADPLIAGRPFVRYPEKTDLILLTSRPPQLETPMAYFDRAITPNDAFFVRYHIFPIPTSVDLATWRLKITGHVDHPLELSIGDLQTRFPQARVFAVNQCSGNGRGHFEPRVLGGQWSNGAMGNAQWVGARLRDILGAASPKPGALEVIFNGLDQPAAPSVPDFVKSLSVTQIMDSADILVAYRMNGEPLPMLNGFPARLVVPGWYSTYWVKNLEEISVLDREFDGFWMKRAYRIPDAPCGCVEPGTTAPRTVPISRMNVRSFIASPADGATLPAGKPVTLKGIAFDGGYGIHQVEVSSDRGATWRRIQLGRDFGPYSFREWSANWIPSRPGTHRIMVRAVNNAGESQPFEPLWNPSGYMLNAIEHIDVHII
jgi:sulfite dehydrogenase (cytochrome) subunit A